MCAKSFGPAIIPFCTPHLPVIIDQSLINMWPPATQNHTPWQDNKSCGVYSWLINQEKRRTARSRQRHCASLRPLRYTLQTEFRFLLFRSHIAMPPLPGAQRKSFTCHCILTDATLHSHYAQAVFYHFLQ